MTLFNHGFRMLHEGKRAIYKNVYFKWNVITYYVKANTFHPLTLCHFTHNCPPATVNGFK